MLVLITSFICLHLLGTLHWQYIDATEMGCAGHVVAVRVTSEDANDGFKPTCGAIEELSFRPSPDVWGYFGVKSGGGIHEFSDSQVITGLKLRLFQSGGSALLHLLSNAAMLTIVSWVKTGLPASLHLPQVDAELQLELISRHRE